MRVDFIAYADDYTARGEIELEEQRLADRLAGAEQLDVESVTVRALDDGREHQLAAAVIQRDELCAVAATGPRGNAALRFRTRPYPMRAQVGPYAVVGYLHVLPTADPRATTQRREVIALSPARLAYVVAGEHIDETHSGLLLVRAKMTLFQSASDEDVGLSKGLELASSLDPNAKDFTGAVRERDLDQ